MVRFSVSMPGGSGGGTRQQRREGALHAAEQRRGGGERRRRSPRPPPAEVGITRHTGSTHQRPAPTNRQHAPASVKSWAIAPLSTPASKLLISLSTRAALVATTIFSSAPLFSSCGRAGTGGGAGGGERWGAGAAGGCDASPGCCAGWPGRSRAGSAWGSRGAAAAAPPAAAAPLAACAPAAGRAPRPCAPGAAARPAQRRRPWGCRKTGTAAQRMWGTREIELRARSAGGPPGSSRRGGPGR